MRDLLAVELADGRCARIAHTTRADGDLSPSTVDAADLRARRNALVAGTWHALRQVHGRAVVTVDGASRLGRPEADALATSASDQILAVHSGDCVPVGFVHEGGAVAAAHAGWKGLRAGVLAATAERLCTVAGAGQIVAAIGPHIRAGNYEFGEADLAAVASEFGESVRATTTDGGPALDLTAATSEALSQVGVEVAAVSPDCTAELADDYWSHRARQEPGRIALIAWLERS